MQLMQQSIWAVNRNFLPADPRQTLYGNPPEALKPAYRHRGAVRVYRQSDYKLLHVVDGPKPSSRFGSRVAIQ